MFFISFEGKMKAIIKKFDIPESKKKKTIVLKLFGTTSTKKKSSLEWTDLNDE